MRALVVRNKCPIRNLQGHHLLYSALPALSEPLLIIFLGTRSLPWSTSHIPAPLCEPHLSSPSSVAHSSIINSIALKEDSSPSSSYFAWQTSGYSSLVGLWKRTSGSVMTMRRQTPLCRIYPLSLVEHSSKTRDPEYVPSAAGQMLPIDNFLLSE